MLLVKLAPDWGSNGIKEKIVMNYKEKTRQLGSIRPFIDEGCSAGGKDWNTHDRLLSIWDIEGVRR